MKGYAEKRRLLRFEKGNVQATDRKRKRQKQRKCQAAHRKKLYNGSCLIFGSGVPSACCFATPGRSMTDTAWVMADGKKIIGSAIPVRMPYCESAAFRERPKVTRQPGSRALSMLWRTFRRIRFSVSGRFKTASSRKVSYQRVFSLKKTEIGRCF